MAHSKTEFELKLVGPARDVAAVPGLCWLDRIAIGPGEWERLTSTYFDSSDLRLNAAGISLRIREEAGIKTLTGKKAALGAAPVLRLETERPFAPGDENFLTGAPELDDIIGPNADNLAPIARTATHRWSRLVDFDSARIEISAEIGSAENLMRGGPPSPLAEIELELMKGDAAALFALARKFIEHGEGRLRPCALSKLARALGATPLASKAPRPAIAASAVAGDILAGALQQIAVRIIESAALVAETHDSDAARRLRVGLRRLRAAARVFKGAIGGDSLAGVTATARTISRKIGAARDLDVFIEKSLPLAQADAARLAPWRVELEARLAAQWNDITLLLLDCSFSAFSLDILSAAQLEPWRTAPTPRLLTPARLYADELLEKRWRRLVGAGASVDFGAPHTLHPLRLKLKKFRYVAQFFRDLYPRGDRKPMFMAMSALQDAFGAVNDAVVAQEIAAGAGEGFGAAAAHAAGFIAGYRSADASAAAVSIADKWREFASIPAYWRNETLTDDPL
jgi:inorganic triphosphatase YgiF